MGRIRDAQVSPMSISSMLRGNFQLPFVFIWFVRGSLFSPGWLAWIVCLGSGDTPFVVWNNKTGLATGRGLLLPCKMQSNIHVFADIEVGVFVFYFFACHYYIKVVVSFFLDSPSLYQQQRQNTIVSESLSHKSAPMIKHGQVMSQWYEQLNKQLSSAHLARNLHQKHINMWERVQGLRITRPKPVCKGRITLMRFVLYCLALAMIYHSGQTTNKNM